MTAIADRPAQAPARQVPWLSLAAPALILVTLVAQHVSSQAYDLLRLESLILMALAAVAGLVIGSLSRLRPETLEPLFTTLLLLVYVFYQPELREPLLTAAGFVPAIDGQTGAFMAVAVGLLGTLALLCWVLRQHLPALVGTVFLAMLGATVALSETSSGRPFTTGSLPAGLNDLPPVIHIILDEHIGLAGMPANIDGSAAAAEAIRSTYEDFTLYSHAYSRYSQTIYSLASLMNGEGGPDLPEIVVNADDRWRFRMQSNRWSERLKKLGYAVSVYQSSYLDLCADADACYTYRNGFSSVQRSNSGILVRTKALLYQLLPVSQGTSAVGSLEGMSQFAADLSRNPRGVAYVVHLLLPHYGYVFRPDCSLSDPATWQDRGLSGGAVLNTKSSRRLRYSLYFDQVRCASRQVQGILDLLQSQGQYEDASIVIHGDHGSRIAERNHLGVDADLFSDRDVLDNFSTLLAVKTPSAGAGVNTTSIAVQDLFAEQFMGIDHPDGPPDTVFIRDGEAEWERRRIRWPTPWDAAVIDDVLLVPPR